MYRYLISGGFILTFASLILGGGTRPGFLSDVILQLIAIPVLLIALWALFASAKAGPETALKTPFQAKLPSWQRWAPLLFCLALVLLPLLQLVPLPPELWTLFPARHEIMAAMQLTSDSLPSMPLSLSPRDTWLSLLALLPPLALFLAVFQLGYTARRQLSLAIITFGLISVFLGLLQVGQGPASPLRFYEFTNPTEAVGFFANRNHYSALLYSVTLFAAAWLLAVLMDVEATTRRGSLLPTNFSPRNWASLKILLLAAGFTIITALVGAQLMARSRAGLGLTILALMGIYLMSLLNSRQEREAGARRKAKNRTSTRVIWAGVALAVIFSAQFALFRLMERFDRPLAQDLRLTIAEVTQKAAKAAWPVGAGMGSFVPVYKKFEEAENLGPIYANHAHNDFLELWLEAGLFGFILLASFCAWYAVRTFQVWRHPPAGSQGIDHLLAQAATLVIALILLHSLVDYPLRTAAMMALFAFACALLVPPSEAVKARSEAATTAPLSSPKPAQPPSAAPPRPQPSTAWPGQFPKTAMPPKSHATGVLEQTSWQDIKWPEEWRKSNGAPPKKSS